MFVSSQINNTRGEKKEEETPNVLSNVSAEFSEALALAIPHQKNSQVREWILVKKLFHKLQHRLAGKLET